MFKKKINEEIKEMFWDALIKDCVEQFLKSRKWEQIRPMVRKPAEIILCIIGCIMCIPLLIILQLLVEIQRIIEELER